MLFLFEFVILGQPLFNYASLSRLDVESSGSNYLRRSNKMKVRLSDLRKKIIREKIAPHLHAQNFANKIYSFCFDLLLNLTFCFAFLLAPPGNYLCAFSFDLFSSKFHGSFIMLVLP